MNANSKLRIAIVDDHPVITRGLCSCIASFPDLELAGVFVSGEDFLPVIESETLRSLIPDIVFMDLRMPGIDGVEVTSRIIARHPHIKVIAYTICSEEYNAKRMFQAGAWGYLTKGQPIKEIRNAIDTLQKNKKYISPDMVEKLAHYSIDGPVSFEVQTNGSYSLREIDILRLMVADKSNKEIAVMLGLSIRTVETERKNMCKKMEVSKPAAMIARAFELGLLP